MQPCPDSVRVRMLQVAEHLEGLLPGLPGTRHIAVPVMRSIARKVPCSAVSQNEIAIPPAPARAVRPMRCT